MARLKLELRAIVGRLLLYIPLSNALFDAFSE